MNTQITSKNLRKYAEEVKNLSKKIKDTKTVKCAKYIVGITALTQLKNKLKNL